jgi:Protein of unknown function (DUF3574)
MNSVRRILLLVILVTTAALGYGLYRHQIEASNESLINISPTLKDDPAHPGKASVWVDTRLYFGLGPADAPDKGVPDKAWRDFLDTEVTPRFPSGLSVQDVYGQWQGKGEKRPERIRTKVLIIDYPATPENDARIEAIRAAWKQRTGDQSVLRVTQAATVSF